MIFYRTLLSTQLPGSPYASLPVNSLLLLVAEPDSDSQHMYVIDDDGDQHFVCAFSDAIVATQGHIFDIDYDSYLSCLDGRPLESFRGDRWLRPAVCVSNWHAPDQALPGQPTPRSK